MLLMKPSIFIDFTATESSASFAPLQFKRGSSAFEWRPNEVVMRQVDEPRFEFDGDGRRLGLVLEPAAKLVHFKGPWRALRASLERISGSQVGSAPREYSRVQLGPLLGDAGIERSFTTAERSLSFSIVTRIIDPSRFIKISISRSGTRAPERVYAVFDLDRRAHTLTSTTGEGLSANTTVEKWPEGWLRIALTVRSLVPFGDGQVGVFVSDENGQPARRPTSGGFAAFGGQLEASTRPTSVAPSTGDCPTGRLSDQLITYDMGSINPRSGSLLLEFSKRGTRDSEAVFALSNGTHDERLSLISLDGHDFFAYSAQGIVEFGDLGPAETETSHTRFFLSYESEKIVAKVINRNCDWRLKLQGSRRSLPTIDRLVIGGDAEHNAPPTATLERLAYWPAAIPEGSFSHLPYFFDR